MMLGIAGKRIGLNQVRRMLILARIDPRSCIGPMLANGVTQWIPRPGVYEYMCTYAHWLLCCYDMSICFFSRLSNSVRICCGFVL
jgi:hypothetical protein